MRLLRACAVAAVVVVGVSLSPQPAAQAAPRVPSRTLVLGGRLIAAVVVERGPPAPFVIAR